MKWCSVLIVCGCSAGPVRTKAPPKQALSEARIRLVERGIQLDPAGERPDRIRTAFHCHVPYQDFDVTFALSRPAPRPFSVKGSLKEQADARARCPYLVRGEVHAQADALVAEAEWWRLSEGTCVPIGNALVGEVECRYDWRGAAPPDNARRWLSRLLQGL